MKKPLVSIITVTLNAELFLESTIKSVAEQDYNNIEYIIIDGGSKDKTLNIINAYQEHINFWDSETDNGIYQAMNKAIAHASGEWVNFMNAGDTFYSEDTLSLVFNQNIKADVIYGDSILVNSRSGTEFYLKASPLSVFESSQMPFVHQSVFLRTELLRKFPYRTDYRLASDYDLFLKLYNQDYDFHYLEEVPVSRFLSDGLHANNRIQYTAECVNSLLATLDNTEEFTANRGIVKAFESLNSRYKNNNLDFSVAFSSLLLQVDQLFNRYNKVLLYGYGLFGQLLASRYESKIVAVYDKNPGNPDGCNIITDIRAINHLDYDKILISVLGREDEITKDLQAAGIDINKIYQLQL